MSSDLNSSNPSTVLTNSSSDSIIINCLLEINIYFDDGGYFKIIINPRHITAPIISWYKSQSGGYYPFTSFPVFMIMAKQSDEKKITSLVKLLKEKGTYRKETDDQLIDSYIFNLWMMNEYYNDILGRGVVTQIGKDNSFFQKNFSVNT
jgi:hypothetical protein